jgi:chorismate synthase
MAGNSFGQLFKVTTFGESHGPAIGCVVDGCPAGVPIDLTFLQAEMDKRRPGQSRIVTRRDEKDQVQLLSGVFEGKTTGMPITLLIPNEDQRSNDYDHLRDAFRPSHADFTWQQKYGHRDYRGGGRSSARETAARVAAGAIAQLLLRPLGVQIHSYVSQVGPIATTNNYRELDFSNIEQTAVRCPDLVVADQMIDYIHQIKKQGDTIGGIVSCCVQGVPIGLGEPVFDKLQADLAKAMLSINAAKGFEYGSGFGGVLMRGSEHNDLWKDGFTTQTNYSGGIQGGISNGMDIYFRVAFKPVATLLQPQESINKSGHPVTLEGKGRHDPCVVPRATPIVTAMAALVLADHYLRALALSAAQKGV